MSDETQVKRSREEFFKAFLEHLTISFLKPIAEGFFENIRQVESLIQVPLIMFSALEVEGHQHDTFRSLAVNYWMNGKGLGSFLEEYGKTLKLSPVRDYPDFMGRTMKRYNDVMAIPVCGEILTKTLQVLHSAAISGCWTAFECLATDVWVAALNEEPATLAQTALSHIEGHEPNELTSKQISVGLAARYGFDLRRSLGTVLKPKFDFTGVSGIQKAYRVFSPDDEFVKKILAQPDLGELEATRHLIVHRASRVDEDYRRRTHSKLEIGSVLTFDREQAERFSFESTGAGIGLIAFVNDWLVKNGKP